MTAGQLKLNPYGIRGHNKDTIKGHNGHFIITLKKGGTPQIKAHVHIRGVCQKRLIKGIIGLIVILGEKKDLTAPGGALSSRFCRRQARQQQGKN